MWMLTFFITLLLFLGSLGALFVQRMRVRAAWTALASFAFMFVCLYQIGSDPIKQAEFAALVEASDQRAAREAGVSDAQTTGSIKPTGAPLNEAQARSFATTALASVNTSCARDLTIVENPPALPNQHVLTVRCGDAATGRVYHVREAEAPEAPAPPPVIQEPVQAAAVESEASEPGECGVTLAMFNKLRSGTNYSTAVRVLGCPGQEMSRVEIPGIPTTVMYTWNGDGGWANMNAMFQDGALISKAQLGLQ